MSFSDILGHERPKKILRNLILSNCVPHAFLFWGPSGVGKKTMAIELAKKLNCQTSTGDACDDCISCRKISQGIHPDVTLISPEGNSVGIDQIHILEKEVVLKPFEGKVKVYVLDGMEKLTQEAGNCLLKTLEEPPDKVVLILVSENKDILLKTIVSRCQIISFGYISKPQVVSFLKAKCGIADSDAEELAEFSGGSIGQALSFKEKDFFEEKKKFFVFWKKLNSMSVNQLMDESSYWSEEKEKLYLFLRFLIYALGKELKAGVCSSIFREAVEKIENAKKQIRYNVNSQLLLDVLLLDLRNMLVSPSLIQDEACHAVRY